MIEELGFGIADMGQQLLGCRRAVPQSKCWKKRCGVRRLVLFTLSRSRVSERGFKREGLAFHCLQFPFSNNLGKRAHVFVLVNKL